MNKSIKLAVAATLLLGGYSSLVAKCPINILNPEITPRPLTYQGVGNISFELLEDKGVVVPAKDKFGDPTCKFNIEFSYVKLKDLDLSSIDGPLLDYFDVEYKEKQNRVYFTQKEDIPADAFKRTDIKVDVVKESTKAQKYNGFQLNVYASSVEGSQFTYTKRDESAAEVEAAEAEAAEEASSENVVKSAATSAVKVAKDSSNLKTSDKENLTKSAVKHATSAADKVSDKVEKVNTRAINSTKEILTKKDKQVSDNSKAKDVKDSDSKKVSSTEEKSASSFGIPSLILMFISLALIGRKEER